MTAIQSRVVANDNGSRSVHTTCRDCRRPIVLACENELGHPLEPNEDALKWADLLVCTACYERIEEKRALLANREQLTERIKAARIPENFQRMAFDQLDRSGARGAVVAAAWAWSEVLPRENAGILIYGPPGTGKSRMAATAAWQRLQRFPVAWASVAHIIAALGASFTDEDRKRAVEVLTGSGALILDDLDKVRPSEYTLQHLFVAIDRRVQAGAPLFVTSNAPPQELHDKFGGPITSRLVGYCQVFELAGWDRRLGN